MKRDVVGILSFTLWIVVIIVLTNRSGGVAEIGRTLFNGWNSLLATLSGNSARSI